MSQNSVNNTNNNEPVSFAAVAVAADHLYPAQQPQAVLLTAEPCALSVVVSRLLLLACRLPGTGPALHLATPPVIHNISDLRQSCHIT